MTPYVRLAIVMLARDRFSTARTSLHKALADATRPGVAPLAYVADPGYPANHLSQLTQVADEFKVELNVVPVGRYATVNHAWNEILPRVAEQYILCVENDVELLQGCLGELLPHLLNDHYDVIVPVVYESDGVRPHFRPAASTIDRLTGGGRRITLDRGRSEKAAKAPFVARQIDIFERHCFVINRNAALALGDWDEQMFCRTDLDLSLACHTIGLRVGLVESAFVQLAGAELIHMDAAFFDYRWDEHRVMRSNERLIAKWQLIGYKRTVNHVHEARQRLGSLGIPR